MTQSSNRRFWKSLSVAVTCLLFSWPHHSYLTVVAKLIHGLDPKKWKLHSLQILAFLKKSFLLPVCTLDSVSKTKFPLPLKNTEPCWAGMQAPGQWRIQDNPREWCARRKVWRPKFYFYPWKRGFRLPVSFGCRWYRWSSPGYGPYLTTVTGWLPWTSAIWLHMS